MTNLQNRQTTQKKYFDRKGVKIHKPLNSGDTVRYLDHNNEWAKGIILNRDTPGPRDYIITNQEQHQIRHNQKHIIPQVHDTQRNGEQTGQLS